VYRPPGLERSPLHSCDPRLAAAVQMTLRAPTLAATLLPCDDATMKHYLIDRHKVIIPIIINMLMLVKQNSCTHLRVLLVLADRGTHVRVLLIV
jgi:hypothetical protein